MVPSSFSDLGLDIQAPLSLNTICLDEIELNAPCGFPSPAADFEKSEFCLNDFFFLRPNATFIVTMRGDAMTGIGIFHNDKLFVDMSIEARDGHIVLAFIDGELIIRRLRYQNGKPCLYPENPDFPVREPTDMENFSIEGVVVSSGRRYF